jgi:hypothetical protein
VGVVLMFGNMTSSVPVGLLKKMDGKVSIIGGYRRRTSHSVFDSARGLFLDKTGFDIEGRNVAFVLETKSRKFDTHNFTFVINCDYEDWNDWKNRENVKTQGQYIFYTLEDIIGLEKRKMIIDGYFSDIVSIFAHTEKYM